MAKNKNKEKPKQNKGQKNDTQACADNLKTDNQKGASSKKDNAGKDAYTQPTAAPGLLGREPHCNIKNHVI